MPGRTFRDALSEADQQLIGRRFWISNPESLPDLLSRIPDTDEVPDIEYRYDETPPKGRSRPFIRCAHCHRQIHWCGNVAKYANGARILLGRNCGEEQFGFIWNQREDSFDERAGRHDLLVRLEDLAKALPLMESFLDRLSKDSSLVVVEGAQRELAEKMPELVSTLRKLIEHGGGSLQLTERIRDVPAELRRDEEQKYAKNPNTKPIYRMVVSSLGLVSGSSFILNHTPLTTAALHLLERCQCLTAQVASLTSKSAGSGAALLDTAEAIFTDTARLLHRIEAPNRFFDLGNLHRIAQWHRKRELGRYSASQEAFSRLNEGASVRLRRRTVDVPLWQSRRHIAQLLKISDVL